MNNTHDKNPTPTAERILAIFPFHGRIFIQERWTALPHNPGRILVRPRGRDLTRVIRSLRAYHGPDTPRFQLLTFVTFDAWRAMDGLHGIGSAQDEATVRSIAARFRKTGL